MSKAWVSQIVFIKGSVEVASKDHEPESILRDILYLNTSGNFSVTTVWGDVFCKQAVCWRCIDVGVNYCRYEYSDTSANEDNSFRNHIR